VTSPAINDPAALLAPFVSSPATSMIVVDFDGSLSPIVVDPATALPTAGAPELLEDLALRFGQVMVVSGRPLAFLLERLPHSIDLVGLYGLEGWSNGARWEHPNGGAWREVMADLALVASTNGPDQMLVELKDLSLTLHYRGHPELASDVTAYASSIGNRAGLHVRGARMSVELQPPIATDKGTVIEVVAGEMTAVLFAGDDVGDLAAFDGLDRLAAAGVHTVRVAVASDESPPELSERADLIVASPVELISLLGRLRESGPAVPALD